MPEDSTIYYLSTRDGWDFTGNHVQPYGPVTSLPTADQTAGVCESVEGFRVYTADELPFHLSRLIYEVENLGKVTVDEHGQKLHRFHVVKRVHLDETFVRFYGIQCAAMALSYLSPQAFAVADFGQVPWLMRIDIAGFHSNRTVAELGRKAWGYYNDNGCSDQDRLAIGCIAKLLTPTSDVWQSASSIVQSLTWVDHTNAQITRDLLFRCIRCCG